MWLVPSFAVAQCRTKVLPKSVVLSFSSCKKCGKLNNVSKNVKYKWYKMGTSIKCHSSPYTISSHRRHVNANKKQEIIIIIHKIKRIQGYLVLVAGKDGYKMKAHTTRFLPSSTSLAPLPILVWISLKICSFACRKWKAWAKQENKDERCLTNIWIMES